MDRDPDAGEAAPGDTTPPPTWGGLFPGTAVPGFPGPGVPGMGVPGLGVPGLGVPGLGAAVEGLLRAAGRKLAGRRVTVPGTGGELSLCLAGLTLRPEPVGLSLGQLGEVRVSATDVRHRGLEAHHAELVGHNVHVRPMPVPTLVAAPVTLELRVRPTVLRDVLAARRPPLHLEIDDGTARVRLARHPALGWIAVTPEVTAEALLLRPRAAALGRRSTPLPSWLPEVRIALPALPRGLRLREVTTGPDEIVLHLHADEWVEAVARFA